jgi:transmembrane sensor
MTEFDHSKAEADRLEREAQAWVTRLTSGEATAADAEALNRWRRMNPAHRRAFAEANLLWEKLQPAAAEIAAGQASAASVVSGAHPRGVGRLLDRRALLGGALAATAAAGGYLLVHPPLGLWPSFAEMTADYRTATGQQREIALDRGVLVQMNTQTSIVTLLPPSKDSVVERIELISGEAAITAGPRDLKPFAVMAARGQTIATNARFNLRNDGAAVCVTCLEGDVDVEYGARIAKVRAKQQVTYTAEGLTPTTIADPDTVTAWQRRLLVFRNDPLARVIDELNRYRPGRIILMNEEFGRQSVLATLRIDRIDEFVSRLQTVFGLKARSLPGGIVLLS